MKRDGWKWAYVWEMCGVGVFLAFFAVVTYSVLLFASSAVNWVTGWSWPHEILAAPLRWFSATNNMFGRTMIWDEDIMVTALYLSPLVLWGVGWWLTSRRIVTADRALKIGVASYICFWTVVIIGRWLGFIGLR